MDDTAWVDYLILGLILSMSCLIGIYFGCFGTKQNTTSEYLYGGRKMHGIPIGISLFSSLFSSTIMIGIPAQIYFFTTNFELYVICIIPACLFSYYIILPVYFDMCIKSPLEYLERRFDYKARLVCAVLFVIQVFIHSAIVLYTCTITLSRVTGAELTTSTWIIGIICVFYTVMGGLKAVIWTDTLQAITMFGTAITILIVGINYAGGIETVWNTNFDNHKLDINFDPNPFINYSIWIVIFGGATETLTRMSMSATSIQRFLTLPSIKQARLSVVITVILYWLMFAIPTIQGLAMYTFYFKCDPLTSKRIEYPDQLLSLFVLDISKHIAGFPGLFVGGVLSSGLSTLSSDLNTVSGIILHDFIEKALRKKISETTGAVIMKSFAAVFGIFIVLFSSYIANMGMVFELAIKVTDLTMAITTGITILGMLFPRANSTGAWVGAVVSGVITTWICIGSMVFSNHSEKVITPQLKDCSEFGNFTFILNTTNLSANEETDDETFIMYRLAYLYYSLFGVVILIVVGIIVSLVSKPDEKAIEENMLSPIIRRCVKTNDQKCRRANYALVVPN